jgi:predicted esterase
MPTVARISFAGSQPELSVGGYTFYAAWHNFYESGSLIDGHFRHCTAAYIDSDRIFLMGHSMGGLGTYYLCGKYNTIWAGLAPISGLGGIADAAAAERYKAIPMLLIHGANDSIIPPSVSRRSAMFLQIVGAPHIYMEFPGMDHEFWIRRGAEHMEKPFLFFSMLSKRTNVGFITP